MQTAQQLIEVGLTRADRPDKHRRLCATAGGVRGCNVFAYPCVGLIVTVALAAISNAPPQQQDDERVIRNMVDHALSRLNRGDLAALDEFWDESADYVGVDGTMIRGRAQIRGFF